MNNALEIQHLEQQYHNTMVQYKQALLDYRNAVQKPRDTYKETNSAGYWGQQANAYYKPVKSVKECEAVCSADSNCDGGTVWQGAGIWKGKFGPYCFTSMNGQLYKYNLPPDTSDDYTAFERPNLSQYKYKVELLESRLRNIIQQIQNAISKNPSDKTSQLRVSAYGKLLTYKDKSLDEERMRLKQEEQEYNNVSTKYDDTFISTVQENSQNSLWIFVTIAVVGVTAGVLIM
jgi:hypothetical protein